LTTRKNLNLGRATLANILGMAAPVLVQLGTVPFYLHAIGVDRYGVMAVAWLLLGYFNIFDFGFGRAITRRIASLHDQDGAARADVFWTGTLCSLVTGLVGGLVLWPLSWYLFETIFHIHGSLLQEARASAPIIGMIVPVATTISALAGTLQGRSAFVSLNIAQTLGMTLSQVAPLFVALALSPSLPALMAAAIIGRLSTAAILFWLCLKHVPAKPWPRLSRKEITPLFEQGKWMMLIAVIDPLLTTVDRFVIGNVMTIAAVACYSIAYNLISRVSMLPYSFQSVIFPQMSKGTESEAHALMTASMRATAWLMTVVCACGILLVKPAMLLWLQHRSQSIALTAAPQAQILLLGVWINALAGAPYLFLQGRGRSDIPAKFHTLEVVVYLPTLFLCLHHFGLSGASIAWDLRVLGDALLLFTAARCLGMLRKTALPMALVLASFAWAWWTPPAAPITLLGTGVMLCLVATWAWRTLPQEIASRLPARFRASHGQNVPPPDSNAASQVGSHGHAG